MAKRTQKFIATIEKPSNIDGAYVTIPFDVKTVFGRSGLIKVKAKFDGYAYRGVLSNMGTGGHILILRKDVRAAIGKNPGDLVTVEVEEDSEPRIVDVPEDLKTILKKNKKASAFYDSLSFTNRKEYAVWISSAKKQETRDKRLTETIKKLLEGRKNPTDKG
jgi:hypothetical protein